MKRYDPIPIIHPGGYQPFAQAGGREQGASLLAMLRGSTFGGQNPMDARRDLQRVAGRHPMTLLDSLRG